MSDRKEYFKNYYQEKKKEFHKLYSRNREAYTTTCTCGARIVDYYLKKHQNLPIHKKNLRQLQWEKQCETFNSD